jgi:hypothetical protein
MNERKDSQWFVERMESGERSSSEELQGVVDLLFLDEASKASMGMINPGEHGSQPFLGFIEEWTCTDDVVVGLEGGGVLVLAGTMEEGWQLVTVFPDTLLEVLSCWSMVSAHLGEGGHGTSVDEFEPVWGSESEEL